MANNVFGNPITYKTLEDMPEYEGKTITRLDLAQVTLSMMDVEDKYKNVVEYVDGLLKPEMGTSTLCLIYNATGEMIRYVCEHNWLGQIGPNPYPVEIANGQWGAFLHVKTPRSPSGSSATIVYRGLNYDGVSCDWMAAWSTPWLREVINNKAYTEIREEGHYDQHDHWDYIFNLLLGSQLNTLDKWNGCISNVTIGKEAHPIFEAIFSIVET